MVNCRDVAHRVPTSPLDLTTEGTACRQAGATTTFRGAGGFILQE